MQRPFAGTTGAIAASAVRALLRASGVLPLSAVDAARAPAGEIVASATCDIMLGGGGDAAGGAAKPGGGAAAWGDEWRENATDGRRERRLRFRLDLPSSSPLAEYHVILAQQDTSTPSPTPTLSPRTLCDPRGPCLCMQQDPYSLRALSQMPIPFRQGSRDASR